ncbi:Uncharacterized protein BC88300_01521 [Bacillus cytotoxicus]|uniref:Uncharacterized protein n=1 Tax=Bacillus cytotoxicus TaxID=580165 RepID=A0AAX2CEZ8_9BACI|nr:Uncharacterized protein BCB44BAC_01444 [Bacillus cytotoxicus]SCN34212.1 Uncharacterized protein BC88300_01521 [Bacillus cytotoxicus]
MSNSDSVPLPIYLEAKIYNVGRKRLVPPPIWNHKVTLLEHRKLNMEHFKGDTVKVG